MIEGIRASTHKSLVAPSMTTSHKALPEGYHFSKVRQEELQVVISRTDIPRREETLARLGSVAIQYRQPPTGEVEGTTAEGQDEGNADVGTLIAWAFLGVDGSLSSLYVEAEHRRRGLAKAVRGLC